MLPVGVFLLENLLDHGIGEDAIEAPFGLVDGAPLSLSQSAHSCFAAGVATAGPCSSENYIPGRAPVTVGGQPPE